MCNSGVTQKHKLQFLGVKWDIHWLHIFRFVSSKRLYITDRYPWYLTYGFLLGNQCCVSTKKLVPFSSLCKGWVYDLSWSSQSKFISLNCIFINAKSQGKYKKTQLRLNSIMPCYTTWKNLLVCTLSFLWQSVFPVVSDCVQDNRNNVGI